MQLRQRRPVQSPQIQYPYGRRRFLLSIAERRFWHALLSAVPKGYTIQCKVRLADIVFVRKEAKRDKTHFNRIQAKHIDFVIGDIATSAVEFAIELEAVSMPILHVKARQSYDAAILRAAIKRRLSRFAR